MGGFLYFMSVLNLFNNSEKFSAVLKELFAQVRKENQTYKQ